MSRTAELQQRGARARTGGDSLSIGETDARALLSASLNEDPFERIEELREAGKRKARAEGVAYRLENERKHLLARISSEYARTHSDRNLSEAKLDRLARADQRYRDHLEGTATAIEERELANSEYWALRARLEWLRAAIAHENALSRLEEPA